MRVTTKHVEVVESTDRLKLTRIPLPGFPKPFDLALGYTDTIWLTGERNAIACLDAARKLTVYPRATGVRPHRLGEHWGPPSVPDGPSTGRMFYFTDPEGDAIGRVTMGGALLPDLPLPAGTRPTALFASRDELLVAAAGAPAIFIVRYDGSMRRLPCPHARIDAVGWGVDSLCWYASGSTLQGLDPEQLVGGKCELAPGTRITDFVEVAGRGLGDRLLYCDEQRDAVGVLEDRDTVVEYQLPAGVAPRAATRGPMGRAWFIGRGGKSLFRLMGLTATEYRCADASADLTRVVYSHDQRETFWFTERAAGCVTSVSMYGL